MHWVALLSAAVLLLCLSEVHAGRDFYKILGVAKNSSKQQIKKAYRALAMQYHPDKNPGDEEANKKFQDIAAAYEVLSDDDKRKTYDARGEEGLKGGESNSASDVFSSMFGGAFFNFGGQQQGRSNERPRGPDVIIDLDATLEQLYNGHSFDVLRAKSVGEVAPGKRQCNCRVEMKTTQVGHGSFQMHQVQVCDECENKKFSTQYRELSVEVEPGMLDNQEIVFYGEGEPHIDGDHGDLKYRIKTLKHPRFRRNGDNLITNVTITLRDALVGFTVKIKHLDEHEVPITMSQIVAPATTIKIEGEGMKNFHNNNQMGDLYVTFDIEFPTSISSSSKEDLVSILGQKSKQRVYNGLDPR